MAPKEVLTASRSHCAVPDSIYHEQPQKNMSPKTTFQSAIYARLDNPLTSLFRLGVRILELAFALGSGISYAIELSHGNTGSAFIYSQVVFALSIITLVIDAVTLRSYRLTFIVESTLCVLWLALFGLFYTIYLSKDQVNPTFRDVNFGRMKKVVWLDMINFLLWLASALFSTLMCCSGIKGMIKGKLERRKLKKTSHSQTETSDMEEGVLREKTRDRPAQRLPLYEEIVVASRT
ncbi:hypothetical protein N0V90_002742 [Kalmusia sp. IMI 367209]|nr:hypothetical protein N0V90_002742 [Kalmusia sp. IMI 367209]